MAAIYSSSYLTIAATHATDGGEGCFSTRRTVADGHLNLPSMVCKAIMANDAPSQEGQAAQVFVRPGYHLAHEDTHSLGLISRDISPLLTRAWFLQELLLSSRILHLHAEEMVWEEDLEESLVWEVPWAHKRPVTRVFGLCNPTWSWTSVHFSGPPPHQNLINLYWPLRGPANDESPNITFLFKDIKATYKTNRANPFGPITDGLLTVTSEHVIVKVSYSYYKGEDFLRIILDFDDYKELVVPDVCPILALSPEEVKLGLLVY